MTNSPYLGDIELIFADASDDAPVTPAVVDMAKEFFVDRTPRVYPPGVIPPTLKTIPSASILYPKLIPTEPDPGTVNVTPTVFAACLAELYIPKSRTDFASACIVCTAPLFHVPRKFL